MIVIRPEQLSDQGAIRNVNEQAFGRAGEATLVDKLRKGGGYLVSLVAVSDDEVVGHILFTPVAIESEGASIAAVGLGPVAVLPAHQRKGIGGGLIRAGLEACRRQGHEVVVVLGHPEYYPRFGFVPAKRYGIRFEQDVPDEVFMVLEMREGALAGHSGVVKYLPEFSGV